MAANLNKLTWFVLLVGSLLRLVWPADMEWKADEKWMYETSQRVVHQESWPTVGIASSVGLKNPGMSVWLFILMAKVTSTPIGMVVCVQWMNVLALWLLFFFIQKNVPSERRQPWLITVMLVAASPLAILFSRKIWAQCLLPPFSVLFLIGHWHRGRRSGAFLWGLSGALLGQIHMSGFFFAFGVLIWTLIKDRKAPVRWFFWFAGSVLGGLGLLPWLGQILKSHSTAHVSYHLDLTFFSRWVSDALGLGMKYSLGGGFFDFLKSPFIFGVPTFAMGMVHLFLLACGLFWLMRLFWKPYRISDQAKLANHPEIRFYVGASFIATGLLMLFSGLTIYTHYLIVVFPFVQSSLVIALNQFPKLLLKIVAAQLIISIGFLFYIHKNGGEIRGDYGTAFRMQSYSDPR